MWMELKVTDVTFINVEKIEHSFFPEGGNQQ